MNWTGYTERTVTTFWVWKVGDGIGESEKTAIVRDVDVARMCRTQHYGVGN